MGATAITPFYLRSGPGLIRDIYSDHKCPVLNFLCRSLNNNFSARTDRESSAVLSCVVHLGVTETAQQLKVVPVETDVRIIDVLRSQRDLVMHDLAVAQHVPSETLLTEPAPFLSVCSPAVLPSSRAVKVFCEFLGQCYLPCPPRIRAERFISATQKPGTNPGRCDRSISYKRRPSRSCTG